MHSTDTKRSKSLKTLALQTAALLKWNLEIFEKELPIANRHQLLSELMKACKVSMPIAPQVRNQNLVLSSKHFLSRVCIEFLECDLEVFLLTY